MKDWKAIAKAQGIDIPGPEADRIASALEALDEAFRPLTGGLTPGQEPSFEFRAEAGE